MYINHSNARQIVVSTIGKVQAKGPGDMGVRRLISNTGIWNSFLKEIGFGLGLEVLGEL